MNALATNPQMQKNVTGAGILAASVMIPAVGAGLISSLGLKYMMDKSLLGKDKGILDEINDILRMGNVITRNASNKINRNIEIYEEQILNGVHKMFKKI